MTAGLTWAPETCPSALAMIKSAIPNAKATARESYGAPAVARPSVAATATAVPANTRMNVPSASAAAARGMLAPISLPNSPNSDSACSLPSDVVSLKVAITGPSFHWSLAAGQVVASSVART